MKHILGLSAVLVLMLTGASTPNYQSNGAYCLSWSIITGTDGNNGTGGAYSLGGTVNRFGADTLGGGSYTLSGGFWGTGLHKVYLPMIQKL